MRESLLALAAGLALPAAALGATLNVNSTADTLVAGDGQCTLREAIINANGDSDTTAGDCAAGSGADLINVPAGTYVMLIGALDITSNLTVRGVGANITVVVGAVSVGVEGTVATLDRLTLDGVTSAWGGVFVESRASLTVSECVVAGHLGGFCALGCSPPFGGVTSFGDTTIRRSAVIDNLGVGIYAFEGTVRVENSTISGNVVPGRIENDGFGTHCATYAAAIVGGVPLSIVNSTIADNHVDTSACGSVAPRFKPAAIVPPESTIQGSVISNPGLENCLVSLGYVISAGDNIDSDGSCGLTDPTDLSNVDPLLGPLQNNGGPTPTHALLRGSPAIDRIPSAACTYDHDGNPQTPEVALTKDQRGGARPREGDGAPPTGCDVGAYEVAACADGRDNDGDGYIDFDGGVTAGISPLASPDPSYASALGNLEAAAGGFGCGLGPELAPALLLFGIARRRSRLSA